MKKLYSAALLLALSPVLCRAQAPAQEKEYIKEMCGCYEVEFKYAETFSEDENYELKDPYSAKGLEWIFVDEEKEDLLVLQHLLIVGQDRIIKHWRQDWLYENQELLEYQKDLEWKKIHLSMIEAKGTWTQKVYQVDDSPRYEGNATWIDVDGKKYWESQVAAPLPRREFTKRDDYNVMLRNNKHKITEYGHVHELDNAKVIRDASGDSVLVHEKGLNIYRKVDDSKCQAAQKWWTKNRPYWVDVRTVWAEVYAEHEYINLELFVEDQKLWSRLFDLGDELIAAEEYDSEEAQKLILEIIESYLSEKPSAWAINQSSEPKH